MTGVPQLRLVVNADTGELVEQDERDLLIDELTRDLHGTKTQLGKLRKELSTLRGLEPEAQVIREVLEYWRERCKPQAGIAPDGTRWQKTRARLREKLTDRPPVTPAELRLAVDGALLDHWHTQKGMGHRLDAEFLFRSYESVERLRDLALGFIGQTGIHLGDLLDLADELRVVNWRVLLRTCECGHKRIEHSKANHEGLEGCFFCECEDFYQDAIEQLNEAKWAKT